MLVNEEQATVTLPPVQFKLLADLCVRITGAYEKVYGPIVISEGDKRDKPSAAEIAERILGAQAAAASLAAASSNEPPPPAKRPRAAPKKTAKRP